LSKKTFIIKELLNWDYYYYGSSKDHIARMYQIADNPEPEKKDRKKFDLKKVKTIKIKVTVQKLSYTEYRTMKLNKEYPGDKILENVPMELKINLSENRDNLLY
jgi:hypothetical protein